MSLSIKCNFIGYFTPALSWLLTFSFILQPCYKGARDSWTIYCNASWPTEHLRWLSGAYVWWTLWCISVVHTASDFGQSRPGVPDCPWDETINRHRCCCPKCCRECETALPKHVQKEWTQGSTRWHNACYPEFELSHGESTSRFLVPQELIKSSLSSPYPHGTSVTQCTSTPECLLPKPTIPSWGSPRLCY